MSMQYEKTIACKQCGEEIGVFKQPGDAKGKWFDVKSGILHTKTCKNPIKFQRRSTYPEKEQYNDSLRSEVAQLREELGKLTEAHVQLVKDVEKLQNA